MNKKDLFFFFFGRSSYAIFPGGQQMNLPGSLTHNSRERQLCVFTLGEHSSISQLSEKEKGLGMEILP